LIYIGSMIEEANDLVFSLVSKKRKTTNVITDYNVRSFSKHLNNAIKKGATMVALIGEKELKNNSIWVKDTKTQKEEFLDIGKF